MSKGSTANGPSDVSDALLPCRSRAQEERTPARMHTRRRKFHDGLLNNQFHPGLRRNETLLGYAIGSSLPIDGLEGLLQQLAVGVRSKLSTKRLRCGCCDGAKFAIAEDRGDASAELA
jgi:hypothetical protein